MPESPLVSESLDVESHIYATINKPRRVPPEQRRTPPPIVAAKPSPRNSQGDENKMTPPKSPGLPPVPPKPTSQYHQADESKMVSQEHPVAERYDREPDDNPANNDVDGEGDKPKEIVGGAQEGAQIPQVKRRPVYAIVVKSSEKVVDTPPKEGGTSPEVVVSSGNEGGVFSLSTDPDTPMAKKSTPPTKPVPYSAESKFSSAQPPPPIHTTSSKSASKYAHLIKSPPPAHAAPKPPMHRTADLSHLKNISPPSHPPPIPPSAARPPKPPRSRSQDGGGGLPTSDPIYEAVDENDASESPGPLPTLKPKYPLLKPKQKPAPPPPNIKKARSLDSPTSKGASLGQSPPHATPSEVREEMWTINQSK